jgi:hypothetical protein
VWCEEPFIPTDSEQKHCKPLHAHRSNKRRKLLNSQGPCPRPDKIANDTYERAAARLLTLKRPDLEVYECRCGKYHIGHLQAASGMDRRGLLV